jgi:Cu-Zn family superoxide dismutase
MTVLTAASAFAWACSESKTSVEDADAGEETPDPGPGSTDPDADAVDPSQTVVAQAALKPTSDGGTLSGTVIFTEQGAVTKVDVEISSGGTAGDHGLHIHDKPSCDPVDGGPGLGAGSHWNPTDAGHGLPSADQHHLGDLGNITIDDKGNGTLSLVFPTKQFYVHDGDRSVVNHAVIFHAQADDGRTQPTGDAGARPGCGVIVKQ